MLLDPTEVAVSVLKERAARIKQLEKNFKTIAIEAIKASLDTTADPTESLRHIGRLAEKTLKEDRSFDGQYANVARRMKRIVEAN